MSVRELVDPKDRQCPEKVRNFDVTDALVPILDDTKEIIGSAEIGSTKKYLQRGDVVISRLRSYLRQIAVVMTGTEVPSVGSTEYIVLRPNAAVSPNVLMVFLRSKPVQTILKYCQEGNQHPRFSEENLLNIPFPEFSKEVSEDIDKKVSESISARQESKTLLEKAKRSVEIAIEE